MESVYTWRAWILVMDISMGREKMDLARIATSRAFFYIAPSSHGVPRLMRASICSLRQWPRIFERSSPLFTVSNDIRRRRVSDDGVRGLGLTLLLYRSPPIGLARGLPSHIPDEDQPRRTACRGRPIPAAESLDMSRPGSSTSESRPSNSRGAL